MFLNSKSIKQASASVLALGMMSACATDGSVDLGKTLGAGIGAAAGFGLCSLAGGTDTECAIAAIAGAAAGYLIAEQIKEEDKAQREATVGTVLVAEEPVVGETTSYSVAETGSVGSVTLLALTTDSRGWQCRQLEENYDTVESDAISETYTMCQNPDTLEWENA